MTELYIDGYPVILPEDFEIDFFAQNPFFTKNGEFTYDIDISLKYPENAKIYQHINRSHVDIRPVGRKAILVSNAMVITAGTEIVLKVENDIAKIQITSGNSELNYLSGGDKKIKELDLGKITALTTAIGIESLTKSFPEYNFVCTPVYYTYEENAERLEASTSKLYNLLKWGINSVTEYESGTELVAQPYLIYYIEKICQVLGYTIESNVLINSDIFRKLIVVNGYKTLNYNEMIPNWKVDAFISEVEKLCNVIFVVNQQKKTIRIMNVATFYETSSNTYIPANKVLDTKEKNFDQDESLYILYKNVKYNLPSEERYQYACLSEEVISLCETIHVPTYTDLYNRDLSSEYNKMIIYVIDDTGLEFVMRTYKDGQNTFWQFYLVNDLKNRIDTETDTETEIKIVPAEILIKQWYVSEGSLQHHQTVPVPLTRNMTPVVEATTETDGLNEYITQGVPESEIPDRIYVAIYSGVQGGMYWSGVKGGHTADGTTYPNFVYPYSLNRPYYVVHRDNLTYKSDQKLLKYGNDNQTLSIKGTSGLYNTLYGENIDVDTDTEHVKNFLSGKILDPMTIFVIDNKKYYCKQLHYKIRPSGISEQVEGTFYPM